MRCVERCDFSLILKRAGGDITIFHFALPSPMTQAFATLDGTRVLQYHNITPAPFFAPYDAGLFRLAAIGRQELRSLVGQSIWRLATPSSIGRSSSSWDSHRQA